MRKGGNANYGYQEYGPLQWGRNMRVAESSSRIQGTFPGNTSMGPQHESCGKHHLPEADALQERTSMGPQHESCGKLNKAIIDLAQAKLQWGRNMRVAERSSSFTPQMAPVMTSMGPQHESCGKAYDLGIDDVAVTLQWGRNMRVAESLGGCRRNAPVNTSMGPQHESCGKNRLVGRPAGCPYFNGAAT